MRENIFRLITKFGGILFLLFFISASQVFGAEAAENIEPVVEGGHGGAAVTILAVAVILFSAKIASLIERVKQPVVIGELLAGIFLSFLGYIGLTFITDIRHNEAVAFLAEFGVILLLFQIGLETNIKSLVKVGPRSLIVALIGASVPFIVGTWVLGPLFFAQAPLIAHLFVGASLVATSVGIPASVYRDLGKTHLHAFKTFLGATVIDDVLGLIILAVVSALASGGVISAGLVFTLAGKAFGFLIGSIILGLLLTKHISKFFSSISTGVGMKLTLAVIFALVFAYGATLVGLAPIVGAFAAGLLLDPVHFASFQAPAAVTEMEKAMLDNKISHKKFESILHKHKHTHVEDLISVLGLIFIPVFFAFTGLQIEIESLLSPQLYISAILITLIAVASKLIAGIATKGSIYEKCLVGISMVPRGEVGLIFAATGLALGAITTDMFSLIVLVIVLTTFIAPPFIAPLIKKIESSSPTEARNMIKYQNMSVYVSIAVGFALSSLLPNHDVTSLPRYEFILYALLAIGLYGSVYGIDIKEFGTHRNLITRAVTIGVLLKSALTGSIFWLIFQSPYAFLFGIIVTQIDPLSVANLLEGKSSKFSKGANTILRAWSSFDDPMTVLLAIYVILPLTITSNEVFTPIDWFIQFGTNILFALAIWYIGKKLTDNNQKLILLATAFLLAVYFQLMLGIALIGLFLRPQFKQLPRLVKIAFITAAVALGTLLEVNGTLILYGITLGALAFLVQGVVTFIIAPRLEYKDKMLIAISQYNGITSIILALVIAQWINQTTSVIAFAVLTINTLYYLADYFADRSLKLYVKSK